MNIDLSSHQIQTEMSIGYWKNVENEVPCSIVIVCLRHFHANWYKLVEALDCASKMYMSTSSCNKMCPTLIIIVGYIT